MLGEVLNPNETPIGIYEDMKFGFYLMTLINFNVELDIVRNNFFLHIIGPR
jgi:hypothetical protein